MRQIHTERLFAVSLKYHLTRHAVFYLATARVGDISLSYMGGEEASGKCLTNELAYLGMM